MAIRGSILLSAFGDALAVPSMSRAIRGRSTSPSAVPWLPPAGTFHSGPGRALGIWSPSEEVADVRGLCSDATLHRAFVVEPWRAATTPTEITFNEHLATEAARDDGPWHAMRAGHARLLLNAVDAAANGTSGSDIWKPGAPVALGIFSHLGAACCHDAEAMPVVYRRFRDLAALDQGHGAAVTGVLAALAAGAAATHEKGVHTHYWLSETARGLLDDLIASADAADERDDLSLIRDSLHRMLGLGINLRPRTEEEFVASRQARYEATKPDHAMAPFDPLVVFESVVASLTYAGSDLVRAFRVLVSGPGDVVLAATTLGTIVGAYLGADRLLEEYDSLDGLAVSAVAETVESCYGIAVDARVSHLETARERLNADGSH